MEVFRLKTAPEKFFYFYVDQPKNKAGVGPHPTVSADKKSAPKTGRFFTIKFSLSLTKIFRTNDS